MSLLIANQVKTNICFVPVKLFIVLTTNVPLFNNYSFVIFICLQPFCKPHLYFILHTTDMFKHATSHKALNYF